MENGARQILYATGWVYLFCLLVNLLILLPVAKWTLFDNGDWFALVVTLFFFLFFLWATVYCLLQARRHDVSAERKLRISGITFNALGTLTCVASAIGFIYLASGVGGLGAEVAIFVIVVLLFAALFLAGWIWHHVGGLYVASIISIGAGFMLAPLSLPQMITGIIVLVMLDKEKKKAQQAVAEN